MSSRQIALQLYTVRDEIQKDFAGTLRQVAALGYEGVEFAGFGELPAQALAHLLSETGLKVAGAHIALAELQGERLDATLAYCRAIGCPTIVLPWLKPELRTLAALQTLASDLNKAGQRCADEGLTFAYHNHNFEFDSIDRRTWFEYLLDMTDPLYVKLEIDVYWAAYAGHEPVALLHQWRERVALLHCKDMAKDRSMTEVGRGVLDMENITRFAQEQGLWTIVEHDHPTLPSLESARISFTYFQTAR